MKNLRGEQEWDRDRKDFLNWVLTESPESEMAKHAAENMIKVKAVSYHHRLLAVEASIISLAASVEDLLKIHKEAKEFSAELREKFESNEY